MIKSFRDAATQALYQGRCPRQFRGFRPVAERKLQMLDSATTLGDLRSPPANRLEKLTGDRLGQWSIRINDQWRICFRWTDAPEDVEIVDVGYPLDASSPNRLWLPCGAGRDLASDESAI